MLLYMIINIKYLIFIILFLVLNFYLNKSPTVRSALICKRYNIFFVILLLLCNKNQVENLFIYLLFLLSINNTKYCENFSDVSNLQNEKESKQYELDNLTSNIIPQLQKELEEKRKAYENDTIEINKLEFKIENLKTTNDILTDINKLNTARKKAIIDNLNVVKNNLLSKITVINTDITSTTNTISSSKEEINKLQDSILKIDEKVIDKKPIFEKEKARENDLNNEIEQINENLEIESNEVRKLTIQNDLDEKKKMLEDQESIVNNISTYIDDETATKKDLIFSLNNTKIETNKNEVKLQLLKELKIDLENRISHANSICDDKFKKLKTDLTEAGQNYVKVLIDNDKNINTLNETFSERTTKNNELSNEISKIEEELNTNEEKKSSLVEQIQDLELQIESLEN